MKKKFAIFLIILFTGIACAKEAIPSFEGKFLWDSQKVLNAEERDRIEEKIEKFNKETMAEMAIMIVKETKGEDIADFAKRVENDWQIGLKKVSKGFVLVLETKTNKWFLLKGYGMEAYLMDHILKEIERRTMKDAMQKKNYAQGIENLIEDLHKILIKDPQTRKKYEDVLGGVDKERISLRTAKKISYAIIGILGSIFIGIFFLTREKKPKVSLKKNNFKKL